MLKWNVRMKGKLLTYFIVLLCLFGGVVYFSVNYHVKNLITENKLTSDSNLGYEILNQKFEGQWSVKDGKLYKGDQLINDNIEIADLIYEQTGSLVTIFLEDIRIATNIVNASGERVVGTKVSDHVKEIVLDQSLDYSGKADILNQSYYTKYIPIRNAEQEVIGMWFVGVDQNFIKGQVFELNISITIISLIFIVFGIVVSLLSINTICRPIASVVGRSKEIANLDLTKDMSDKLLNRKDEMGDLSKALQTIITNLREMVKEVQHQSEKLASSSEELTATSQQSAIAADEIAGTIEEIANGANEQAKDTEKGVININQLGELIEKDQKYVLDFNTSADEVSTLKDEGLEVLKELVEKTHVNNKATKDIHGVIVNTNESAEKIVMASQMIERIAEQTNLLALNAAIEAARAGDAGRGFAVVAEEIRKLAEQSNTFTGEISKVIQELVSKTGYAVNTMEEVEKIVASQSESVEKTNEKFEGIAIAIEKMKKAIDIINQSSHEMETKKDEIIGVIENLSAISQENASGTEEVSASVEEQTASMEQIANASEVLAKLAEEMNQSIAKFKY